VKEPQSGCLTHWKTDKQKRIQLIESMHKIDQEEPPKEKKKKKRDEEVGNHDQW